MKVQKTEERSAKKVQKQTSVKQKGIEPFVKFFLKHDTNPNTLTYIGLICSAIAAVLLACGWIHHFWLWSFPVTAIIFSGVFDLIDGEVARRKGADSEAGAFLDSNIDRISDAVIILGIAYAGLITFELGYIIMFLIVMISYSRSRAESLDVDMKGVGRMERTERFFFLIFALFGEFMMYYFLGISIIFVCMVVFALLLAHTFLQRLVFGYRMLKSNKNEIPNSIE